MSGIVRNITNNELYVYLGDNKYRNLRTGGEGEVTPNMAKKVFKINVECTIIYNENPLLENLIKELNLKIEK